MYVKVVYTIIALLPAIVRGSLPRGAGCVTPNEEIGTCKPLKSCNPIYEALSTRSKEAIKFAQRSQCGFDTEPLVCCGSTGYPSPKVTRISPLLPDRTECGVPNIQDKITGGEITGIDEFPWMALLAYKTTDGSDAGFKCAGTIINKRYVLTAAHCVLTSYKGFHLDYVRLGEWKISTVQDCYEELPTDDCADPVSDLRIEQIISHPQYNRDGRNDIALLRLTRDVTYTMYIKPICLPLPNSPLPSESTRLTVSGWGATEHDTKSDVKLKLLLPLVSRRSCAETYQHKDITEYQLCAGGVRGKDSCRGDSGGPLMGILSTEVTDGDTNWYQEGIVSQGGYQCGIQGYPAIYTRVSKYVNWIVENIKES